MASSSTPIQEALASLLARMRGEVCWSVIAGVGTGSQVSMRLGKQVPMHSPLRNPNLTDDERKFDGEFTVFIENALWTVHEKGRLLCDSDSSNMAGGPMVVGLRRLVGTCVRAIELTGVRDLRMQFSDGLILDVVCDGSGSDDSYTVGVAGERSITADSRGELRWT
jgi:hypothetical protein